MSERGALHRPAAAWLVAVTIGLGCNDAASPSTSTPAGGSAEHRAAPAETSPAPDAKTSPAPSTTSAVERELAYAGYYGDEIGRRAWEASHETCPGALDGQEMIGRTLPEWHLDPWLDGETRTLASLRGRVVVVRFWTAPGCPYCEKTLPALQRLAKELEAEPVTFVGAFHGKPAKAYPRLDEPSKVLKKWGVDFPVALDPEWSTLRSWWYADGAHRHASSVTFVIAKDGKLLHVHPGPVFHPSDDPDEAKENEDYLAVRSAIRRGLDAK